MFSASLPVPAAPRVARAQGTPLISTTNGDGQYPTLFDDWLVFSRLNNTLGKYDSNGDGIPDLPLACCADYHDTVPLIIKNTGSAPLEIQQLTITQQLDPTQPAPWVISNTVTLPAIIAAGDSLTLTIRFTATSGPYKHATYGALTIVSNAANEPNKVITLAGLWQDRAENNEAYPADLIAMFGYKTIIEYPNQTLNGFRFAYGEEVYAGKWRRANAKIPVFARQIAAFHGCCNSDVSFSISTTGPNIVHARVDSQTILPRLAPTGNVSPTVPAMQLYDNSSLDGANGFTISVAGYSSNRGTLSNTQKRGTRFWPVRDQQGRLVPNSYLVVQDYVDSPTAANFDYQDNVYVITNIRPIDPVLPDPYRLAVDPSIPGPFPGSPDLVLEFDQAYTNTLTDTLGLGIGFPEVQINRTDNPSTTTSYSPTQLLLDPSNGGSLTINTTNTTNSGNATTRNNLINGVRLPFDARASDWVISTRIRGSSIANLTTPFQQGGLMFGPDQDNYIKLVALSTSNGPKVELFGELGFLNGSALPGTLAQLPLDSPASIEWVDLRLLGNPVAGIVQAAFDVKYAGNPTLVTSTFTSTIPLSGEQFYRFFERRAKAGLIALSTGPSGKPTPAPIPIVFDRFAITSGVSFDGEPALKRIDVGTRTSGRTPPAGWTADTSPEVLFQPTGAVDEPTSGYSATLAISNTNDDALYTTYRGNVGSGSTPLASRVITYNIPVAAPVVDLRLHFAELYHGVSTTALKGERSFDLFAEGQQILDDFDPGAAAGAPRTAITVPIKTIGIVDGTLTLVFKAEKDYPAISAIEVFESPAVPIANAGPDQTVDINSVVTLNGSASTNPIGGSTVYTWTQGSGTPVTLNCGPNPAICTFTAPPNADALGFVLQIGNSAGQISSPDPMQVTVQNTPLSALNAGPDIVTTLGQPTTLSASVNGPNPTFTWDLGDGSELSGPNVTYTYTHTGVYIAQVRADNGRTQLVDTVRVTVQNLPPQANAGPDRVWEVGSTVLLDGSTSSDPDGHVPLGYRWSQLSGPPVSLSCVAGGVGCSFPAPNLPSGPYSFRLVVTDTFGLTGTDTISVSVNDIAVAGLNAASSAPTTLGQATQLSATLLVGSNVTYTWSLGDGRTASGANPSTTYAAAGVYTATVTARNGAGSVQASTRVTVTNQSPLANGGPDQVVDPGAAVTLSGAGSDPDGHTPLSYSWRQTEGPSVSLSCSASGASCSFSAPDPAPLSGVSLVFEFVVTDSRGQQSIDIVFVDVGTVTPTNPSLSAEPLIFAEKTGVFTATAVGANLSYSFDFGDGRAPVQDSDGVVSYAYSRPGTYTVAVTASNSAGSVQTTLLVVVVAKGEAPTYTERLRLPLTLRA